MYGNSRFAAILEVPSQNIIGRSIRDFVSLQDVPRFKSFLQHCENNPGRGEFQFKTNNKKTFPALVSCNALNLDFHGLCIVITDLTGQKKIEVKLKNNRDHLEALVEERTKALRESEARLELALEASGQGVWETDLVTEEVAASRRMAEIFGLDDAHPLRTRAEWRALILPEDLPSILAAQVAAAEHNGKYSNEYRIRRANDGAVRWIHSEGQMYLDAQGRPLRSVGMVTDITERKQVEEELAAAHNQIQNIIDNTTAIVYAFDLEGRFVLVNTAVAKLFNSTSAQMNGKRRHDFMPQVDADWHEANDRKVIEAGQALDFEEKSELPGRKITWLTTKFPLRDAEGKIYAVGGISTDISERKRVEEAMLESEKRLQTALRVSHSFAFEWDPVSDRVVRSESCGPVLGLSEEEARSDTGQNYFQRLHPEDRDRFVNTLKALKPGINTYLVEYRIMRGDGAMAVLEEMAEASFDEDGKLARLVGTSTDITIRKEAEEILKRDEETLKMLVKEQAHDLVITQIELERAKRLADIGVLAATVAHELRNPLAAVGLSAYHIKKLIKDPRIQEDLTTIDKRISEADQIINNVLSYSKIKTGRFQPIKINSVLKECIDEVIGRFPGQTTAVNVKTDPTEVISIEADPLQMKEVFSNVLNNAFDALNKDDGIINIESRVNDSGVAILIKDNGEGIDKENLQKIFDPFFTTKTKGTGLGLAVCNRLVMLHAGSIAIESEKGKGTMVSITLPIRGGGGAIDA